MSDDFDRVPVVVGDEIELVIVGMGERGDPLGRYKGYSVFVRHKGLQLRDRVRVRIARVFARFAFSDLVSIIESEGVPVG